VFPYAKTGGLGDVAGALPVELSRLGHEVKVFMPKYNIFGEAEFGLHYNWEIGEIPIRIDGQIRSVHIHTAVIPGSNVEIYFVDCPHYFHRFRVYTNDADEDERFILFSKGIIEILQRLQWAPDILHCNDWQTGLLPLLLKENYSWDRMFDKTATVFSIHNISYQGVFPLNAFHKAEINPEHFLINLPAGSGSDANFMKAAILFSDVINTVSETYEKELMTPEYGCGMESFLIRRADDLYGILNGIDYDIWNPETDKLIPYNYSLNDLSGKIKNKKFLLERLNLAFDEKIPLIGLISRLVDQKGFDLISYGINQLMELNAQWVILGSGEEKYESLFYDTAKRFPDKVSTYLGYNNELSHLIEAGADLFLMPSRFEPCGLNQIYSLKYGTVPVVRKTGGLADTVQDWNELLAKGDETGNGFSFSGYSAIELLQTVRRGLAEFGAGVSWNKIQANGMSRDHSWRKSAEKYVALYEKAVKKRGLAN
jgi:starch synthase